MGILTQMGDTAYKGMQEEPYNSHKWRAHQSVYDMLHTRMQISGILETLYVWAHLPHVPETKEVYQYYFDTFARPRLAPDEDLPALNRVYTHALYGMGRSKFGGKSYYIYKSIADYIELYRDEKGTPRISLTSKEQLRTGLEAGYQNHKHDQLGLIYQQCLQLLN